MINSLIGRLTKKHNKKDIRQTLLLFLAKNSLADVLSSLLEKAKTKRYEDLENLAYLYFLIGEPAQARQLMMDNGLNNHNICIKASILQGIPVADMLDQIMEYEEKITKDQAFLLARGVKTNEDKTKLKNILLRGNPMSGESSTWKLRVIGEASRRIGDYKDAMQAYRRAFNLTCPRDIQELSSDKNETSSTQQKKVKEFHCEKAWKALHDFKNLAEKGWVLDAGTLLGFIREGNFLQHDYDLDISFVDKQSFLATKDLLYRSPFFEMKPGRVVEVFKVRHLNGMNLDIFLYKKEGTQMVKESHVYRWVFNHFDVIEQQFGNITLPVPSKAEKHLEETYGDWWVPRKNFDGRYDALNVSFPNIDELECVILNKAVKALTRNDYGAAKKELNMLKRIGRSH